MQDSCDLFSSRWSLSALWNVYVCSLISTYISWKRSDATHLEAYFFLKYSKVRWGGSNWQEISYNLRINFTGITLAMFYICYIKKNTKTNDRIFLLSTWEIKWLKLFSLQDKVDPRKIDRTLNMNNIGNQFATYQLFAR